MFSYLIDKCFGKFHLGRFHYWKGVRFKESWEGVFNDQVGRREIFDQIIQMVQPDAIIETGTFRGSTTNYLATSSGLPVVTAEGNPYNAGYAAARLKSLNVNVMSADSRTALKTIFRSGEYNGKKLFFYLDAHWEEDLPLVDELELIFGQSEVESVVMVDDFCVSDDSGYRFDDYGENGVLKLSYIDPVLTQFKAESFFPSIGSDQETGAKRGSVVLANSPGLLETLSQCEKLRHYPSNV